MSSRIRRLAVGIEYDGSRFAGWQYQPGLLTVQDAVQQALSAVADHPVTVAAAGRTDAGVHATGQVAHFETRADRPVRGWVLGTNSHLPPDIALNWAMEVEPSFHARHTAQGRSYRYYILRRATRPAILRERVCWTRAALDAEAMHEGAQALVGEHDRVTPHRSAAVLAAALPDARLEVLERAGHVPMMEVPDAFNARVDGFARSVLVPRSARRPRRPA